MHACSTCNEASISLNSRNLKSKIYFKLKNIGKNPLWRLNILSLFFTSIRTCLVDKLNNHYNIIVIPIVGSQFAAQAQNVWSLGPMSSIQWICREWVKKLGPNDLDNG